MSNELVVVKSMSPAELKAWRGKNGSVQSAPGHFTRPDDEQGPEIPVPAPVKPLDATDTWQSMFRQLYENQRRDRDAYEKAIRWMRAMVPSAVGYMTDDQLRDYLDMRCREAVTKVLRDKGTMRSTALDGVW